MISLSIAKKVWLSFSILVIGYFISMATGYYLGLKTEAQIMRASDSLFPATIHSYSAMTAFEEQIKGYTDAILMGEESIFEMTQEKSDEVKKNLESILKMPGVDDAKKQDMTQVLKTLAGFTAKAQGYYGAISREEAEMDDTVMGQLAEQTELIKNKLSEYKSSLATDLKGDLSKINKSSKNQRMMNLWLFLVVVIVGLLVVGFIVSRAISRPIANTVSMLKDIAEGEGDLTKRLEINSKDEMGEVAKWFNHFYMKHSPEKGNSVPLAFGCLFL